MVYTLLLSSLIFSAFLSCNKAIEAQLQSQNQLLDRVKELVQNRDIIVEGSNLNELLNYKTATLLLQHQAGVGQNQESPQDTNGDGAGQLFSEDFKVETTNENINPLDNIEQRTKQVEEETTNKNPQEERLLNKEYEKKVVEEPLAPTEPEEVEQPKAEEEEESGQVQEPEPEPEQEEELPEPEPTEIIPVYNVTITKREENLFFGDESLEPERRTVDDVDLYTTLLCIGIGFILIIVIFFQYLLSKYFNSVLLKSINHVSRDVIVIMGVVTFILWLNFEGVEFFYLNINVISLCFLIFGLSWLVTAAILIIAAQSFSVNWEEKEIKVKDREQILETYCEYYDKVQTGSPLLREEHSKYKQYGILIDYFLLRQNFLAPSYLPSLSDKFLRDDFNFAEYLTLALEKVIMNLFEMSLATVVTLVLVLFLWAAIVTIESFLAETIVFGLLLPFSLVLFIMLRNRFLDIYTALKSPISDPHNLDFVKLDTQKDPWTNLQNPPPRYLALSGGPLINSIQFFSGQKLSNLQERLFWYFSPKFSLKLVHALIVAQITWGIIFYGYYLPQILTTVGIVFSSLLGLVIIINFCFLVPITVFYYSIITNIEMMKDIKLIKITIGNQRELLRIALLKLYRLLKSARRELNVEERSGVRVKDFIIRIIKNAFKQINPTNWSVQIQDLPSLTHLCGSKLEKDEMVYLARDSSVDLQTISIDDLILAVEKITEDVKLEPYETSSEVLKSFITREEDFLTLKEFRNILTNHKILQKPDVDQILHEMKYLTPNNEDIDISNISALIRNMIEGHAR